MQIFLSYASEDKSLAEEIQLALLGVGHVVFFDKASLPAGGDYHSRIDAAVKRCDLFIFLISPNSVASGSYARTELKFARSKWHHPKEHVLPVRLHETPWDKIPPYLKSVTILEPEGNIPAEIVAAISKLQPNTLTYPGHQSKENPPHTEAGDGKRSSDGGYSIQVWMAIISLISALGVALISNGHSLFAGEGSTQYAHSAGMKGPDTGNTQSQVLNENCPEVTEFDYSKIPPESKIVKRCPPL
jgi:hypothetical protein